jgi:hypothetical protein
MMAGLALNGTPRGAKGEPQIICLIPQQIPVQPGPQPLVVVSHRVDVVVASRRDKRS